MADKKKSKILTITADKIDSGMFGSERTFMLASTAIMLDMYNMAVKELDNKNLRVGKRVGSIEITLKIKTVKK